MSAQTTYGFRPVTAVAGGIVDLSVYRIDAFANEEETGVMRFGLAVVAGSEPGRTIKLPAEAADVDNFLGVTVNNLTTEHDLEGVTYIRANRAMGVMRYGRIWVRVPEDTEVEFGEPLCVITDGENNGYFTNDTSAGTAINGRFIGPVNTRAWIAPAEIYDQTV